MTFVFLSTNAAAVLDIERTDLGTAIDSTGKPPAPVSSCGIKDFNGSVRNGKEGIREYMMKKGLRSKRLLKYIY